MTPKHTPGPWTGRELSSKRGGDYSGTHVCDEYGNSIAKILPVADFGVAGDDDANTRVMVLAPNMLVLLEQILDAIPNVLVRESLHHSVDDLIAKARGR